MQFTVMIVDDHPVFREGLRILLKPHSDLQVVGEVGGASEAYAIKDATRPDVVVLDMRLGGSNGVEVAREMIRRDPQSRILMLTMVDEAEQAAQAFAAGALGYAIKDQTSDSVAEAIRVVARGAKYLAPTLSADQVAQAARSLCHDDPLAELTSREREIFHLTITGATSGEIGEKLFISPRTVETHRARILHKLHARSTLDLVRMAARMGMLDGPKRGGDA